MRSQIQKLVYAAALFCYAGATATQDQIYGLGGISSGRVGAVGAETELPFAAIINPATLAAGDVPAFALNVGAGQARPSVAGNVLLDSPTFRTRSGVERSGAPELAGSSATLWGVGLNYPFNLPKWADRRAGFGIVASGPLGQLRRYASVTPYDFSMLKYGTSEAQFKVTTSLGLEILKKHFYAGVGTSFYLNAAGDAEAQVVADNPTGRLALDVGLSSAVVFGLFARLDSTPAPHQLALVYRQAVEPTFTQRLEGTVQILRAGGLVTVPAVLTANLYYEPESVELDWQKRWGEYNVSLGVAYQAWSKYRAPYVVVGAEDAGGTNRSTYVPSIALRDTLNPKAAVDGPLFATGFRWSLGYQYRPSAITDLSGDSNLLDVSTHVLGVSVRRAIPASEILPLPLEVGAYGQWHLFETTEVTKVSSSSIGAPGYKIQGNAYTYGISLQANF